MDIRNRIWLIFAIFLAAGLTFFKIPIASSQGISLVVAPMEGDLPAKDPNSSLWQEATAIEVPLSAQNVSKPRLLNPTVRTITARALHNDSQIAILVTWSDPTKDEQMVRVQDFRDAVAVQFPLAAGLPYFCMGQQDGDVNIWHWKADWQADMAIRQDVDSVYENMYVDPYSFAEAEEGEIAGVSDYTDPSYLPALDVGNLFAVAERTTSVEDLMAGGFGTLTAQSPESQNVQGYGAWEEGKWSVIFSRELSAEDRYDISFAPSQIHSIAFAVWDGANGERNGQKSTSQWVSLRLKSAPSLPAERPVQEELAEGVPLVFWIIVAASTIGFAGFIIYALRQPTKSE